MFIKKLPIYLFFIWRLDLMLLMGTNPLLGPLEGVGPEILDFFGPRWHSLRWLPFLGPKSHNILGPTPSGGPRNGFATIKIITSRAIWTIATRIAIFSRIKHQYTPAITNNYIQLRYVQRSASENIINTVLGSCDRLLAAFNFPFSFKLLSRRTQKTSSVPSSWITEVTNSCPRHYILC